MSQPLNNSEARQKLEHYCAYQDRCHQEVVSKLYDLGVRPPELDEVIVHLIASDFLNEERFACSFARGKHRIKHWGNVRIVNELKFRRISSYNIKTALKEITLDEYLDTFNRVSERHWEQMKETNVLKKRKKFCDYLLRKGFENHLVYDRWKELENDG